MPVSSTYVIVPSGEEEAVLAARAQSVRGQYCDRFAGQDRARSGRRPQQRGDRRGGGGVPGHGPQVAPPVRGRAGGNRAPPAERNPWSASSVVSPDGRFLALGPV